MSVDPVNSDAALLEDEDRPTPKPTPNAIPKIPRIIKIARAIAKAAQMNLDLDIFI